MLRAIKSTQLNLMSRPVLAGNKAWPRLSPHLAKMVNKIRKRTGLSRKFWHKKFSKKRNRTCIPPKRRNKKVVRRLVSFRMKKKKARFLTTMSSMKISANQLYKLL